MHPIRTAVAALTVLAALALAAGSAAAGERSYGFIHVASNGSVSQALSSRPSGREGTVSIGSDRCDGYRSEQRDRGRERNGERFEPRGSFIYASSGVDAVYWPSLYDVAYGGYRGDRPAPSFPSQPIVHIDTERLDRRPIGPSGIEVISNGGAKIIRIAPGYSSTGRRLANAEPPRRKVASAYLQPWTEAWSKHCVAAFDSFNPELGTYRDAAGKVRFCTADE